MREMGVVAGILTAVAVMGPLTASAAASEAELVWGLGTTWITAQQDPSEASQVFSVRNSLEEPLNYTCDEFTGKAMVAGTRAAAATLEGSTYSDSGPKAEELKDTCTGAGGSKPLVKMNGCNFRFHVGATVETSESEGSADIVCPAGKEVEIAASVCLVTIPSQEGLGPVFFRTVSVGGVQHVTIEARIGHNGEAKQPYKYSTSGLACGTHNNETDGTYTGKFTAKGSTAGGKQTALAVEEQEEVSEGGGKEGTFSWESGTTKLVWEGHPGDPSQLLHFEFAGITSSYTCSEVSFEATGLSGTGASSVTSQNIHYADVATTPEVDRCTGTIEAPVSGHVTVKTTYNFNGCDYHFIAGTTISEVPNGETEGTLEIKCPENQKIKFTEAGCTVEIGPQTLGPIYYSTEHTTGKSEEITAEARIGDNPKASHNNAIDYHTSGLTCGVHDGVNGTYTGKFTIKAVNGGGTQTNVTVT